MSDQEKKGSPEWWARKLTLRPIPGGPTIGGFAKMNDNNGFYKTPRTDMDTDSVAYEKVVVDPRALVIAEESLSGDIEELKSWIASARSETSQRCLRWKGELKDIKWARTQIRKALKGRK